MTQTANFPKLLSQKEVSLMIHKSTAWLERARWSGKGGPPFRKIGRSVRYDLQDVLDWLEQQPRLTKTRNIKFTGQGK